MDYTDAIKALSRAKCLVLWTQTREEQRAERKLIEAATALQMKPYIWTVTKGLYDTISQTYIEALADPAQLWGPAERNKEERALYIIKDFSEFIAQGPGIRRYIRDEMNDGRRRPAQSQKLFVFLDLKEAPEEIPGIMQVDLSLPDRPELEALLKMALEVSPEELQAATDTATQAACIDAMTGLDSDTARNAILKSRVNTGSFSPEYIQQEKKSFIKSSALQWTEPEPGGLEAIGGLEILKSDLLQMKEAFTPEAEKWGVPAPAGALICGIPGTGKSLTAKAAATVYRLPLIKFDIASLFGKYVGDSESAMREALKIIDATAPAVVWLDEIEKAFSGLNSDGDGGTAKRMFGNFLTWTQEKTGKVFLIATANNVEALPPELKRRFDRLYFVDVPHQHERTAIADVMKNKFPHCENVESKKVSMHSESYTGAEIEKAFKAALNTAYHDGARQVHTADVINALTTITPVIKSDAKQLETVKQWSITSGARTASKPPEGTAAKENSDFIIE